MRKLVRPAVQIRDDRAPEERLREIAEIVAGLDDEDPHGRARCLGRIEGTLIVAGYLTHDRGETSQQKGSDRG